jgi:hypothetical protein
MGQADRLEHFPQFAFLMIKVHKRADLVRRKIEGTLHLPVIQPVFHVRGNPDGFLNFVPLNSVVAAMSTIKEPGVFWLTNPQPPTLQQTMDWLGEAIELKIIASQHFNATPIEMVFERMTKAFAIYMEGDYFHGSIEPPRHLSRTDCDEITAETIREMVGLAIKY